MLGGIRSGKSRWAEQSLDGHRGVRYIATGADAGGDPDWARRIAAHRERRPAGWRTVESPEVAEQLQVPDGPTLVDDVGGWLARTLDRRGWQDPIGSEVTLLLEAVDGYGAPLVLVSPEVGLSVVPATAAGRRFADELGDLNRRLADRCERVVLVVAGQPLFLRGGPRR